MRDLRLLFTLETGAFPVHLSPKPENRGLVEAQTESTLPFAGIPEWVWGTRSLGVGTSPKLSKAISVLRLQKTIVFQDAC